jgi:SAM-dependent methyltransferase
VALLALFRAAAAVTQKLYRDLAAWWPLFSPPSEYVEEAEDLLRRLTALEGAAPRTLLELGCGGGSLAWHLKSHLTLTLTDISPQMLAVSQAINRECEHVLGDMRTLDLGRQFDRVLIHDAIMYLTEPDSVRAAIATAYRHTRPGGATFILPDHVRETFTPRHEEGGHDAPDGRGMRYIEWTWDPDPSDTTYVAAYGMLMREADGAVHSDSDVHIEGLFPRAAWLQWLREAGFEASSSLDAWERDVFVGRRSSG